MKGFWKIWVLVGGSDTPRYCSELCEMPPKSREPAAVSVFWQE